jgi:LuxR family transcriptional regulator of csgAB operon
MTSHAAPEVTDNHIFLHVVGKNRFNNEILSDFLEAHTGISRGQIGIHACWSDADPLADNTNLILMDYMGMKQMDATAASTIQFVAEKPNHLVILFNVGTEGDIAYDFLNRGVKGIIYKHQPIAMYPKAVLTVLGGELWFPRRILELHFLSSPMPPFIPTAIGEGLTSRQKEILSLLRTGRSNQEIARNLGVSPHTIRAHIYTIYKKINVHSRLEASLRMIAN